MSLDERRKPSSTTSAANSDLKPDEQFLDIGCGWGGLILYAAERYGVRAVGITLSDDQHDYVSQQIEARGLMGRVEVRRMDYRRRPRARGYDKIASVGMFEHVAVSTSPPISTRSLRC